jgi:mRNA-degrading endonuclease toxin of MazEF toxin-antitoxin module
MTRHDDETRKKALELSDQIGCKATCEQMGISTATLNYWRQSRKKHDEIKLSGVQKPFSPEAEIADNPYVSYQTSEEEREFKRGEIYYIARTLTTGSEIATGRPAIIVSNSEINRHMNTVEVVYLRTRPREIFSSHVVIKSSGVLSTAICEQISTVDIKRIKNKVGECTPEEMEKIDIALLSSLGLDKYSIAYASSDNVLARVSAIMAERDAYKEMCTRIMTNNS